MTVRVKNVKKTQDRIARIIRGSIAGSKELTKIDRLVVNEIRKGRLPSGEKIKPLASKTKKRRKRLESFNSTGKNYNASRSNLTFTGRFLESFKTTISRIRGSVIIRIAPTGIHKGYRLVRGGREKAVNNQQIAKVQIDQGRDFTIVGDKMQKKIKNILISIIKRALN